jgi:hypothetical protein
VTSSCDQLLVRKDHIMDNFRSAFILFVFVAVLYGLIKLLGFWGCEIAAIGVFILAISTVS